MMPRRDSERSACEREIRVLLGQRLREFYQQAQQESPLPERLTQLLEHLKRNEEPSAAAD